MTKFLRKSVAALTLASSLAITATPADAQYRYRNYRHHRDHTGAVIGAGLLGLGIGAAISSSNRGYYGRGYYDRGYYDRGYYRDSYYDPYYRGYYGRRCATRWEYDPYYDDYVRVRYC
jgi:hypothetical protein